MDDLGKTKIKYLSYRSNNEKTLYNLRNVLCLGYRDETFEYEAKYN